MARSRVAATLRSTLFNTSSVICLSRARNLLLPMVAGAAFALGGTAFSSGALAAAGACAPDANGTPAATGPTESCSGDFATGISYPGALGTGGNFEVDLNSVTNVTDGGIIVGSGGAVNVTVTQFAVAGNISNAAGNGIEATTLGGNISITTVGGNVTASGIGIYGEQLLAAGNGSVTINVAGNIAGSAGIVGRVQGDGSVTIDNSGNIAAASIAIYAQSSGGDIVVGYNGFITGNFSGTSFAGIEALNTTGSTTVRTMADMSSLSGAVFGIRVGNTTTTAGGISIDSRGQIGNTAVGGGVNGAGIYAESSSSNVTGIALDSYNKIYVDSGVGTFGIYAVNQGSGSVAVRNLADISQPETAIRAQSAGAVNVTNIGVLQAVTIGISAESGTGSAVVMETMATTVGNVTFAGSPNLTVSAGNFGIRAVSVNGDALVSGTGADLAGNGTNGDDGLSGNVSLTAGTSGAFGIAAASVAAGNATVRLAANTGNATSARGFVTVNSADRSRGIFAQTTSGDAIVTLLDNTAAGSSVTINALTTGNVTTGANNTGIASIAGTGNATIVTGAYDNTAVVGDNSSALSAQAVTGNVTVTTGLNSTIAVTPNSSIANENPGNATASFGIFAQAAGGGGSVIVVNNAVLTVSNNSGGLTAGIFAQNGGSGALAVVANSAITSNGGSAIAAAGGAGSVTINNNALIRGLGTSLGTAVVNVSSSAATITINNNSAGVVASVGGLASDFAIGATTGGTGAVNIYNAGRITGAINVSGAGAVAFNNSSATSWHTSGTSTFTNGYDALNNQSSGRIATSGATTFNFMDGAIVPSGNTTVTIRDDFINAGTLVVGETSAASSLTITKGNGTLAMSNAGTIILGGQSTGLNTDGQTNDQLLAKGANMAFLASGNSRLKIDAFLGAGAEAQSSAGTGCALTAAFADCMTIGASSVATGSTGTRVSINDTNSAGSGTINLPGTVIVDGTSGAAGEFFLSTADTNVVNTAQGLAIRKGFVLYQLVFDAANVDWDLVGMPAAETFELSKVTAGLQTMWHETADGWNERTSAIRHDFAADTMVRAWTIWGKAYYGQANRDSDNTIVAAETPFTFDTTYTQSYGGIQFGADVSRRTANGAWALGGLFGYNKTRVEFDASTDSIDGTVINIGAYGSFMAGPFFADVLVKDDIATLDFDLPAYAGVDNVDANSLGAELTFGGRFGRRIVFEPLGTLAYVKTAVGNLDSAGMNFNWEDGTSFRGIFALRLSGELGPGQTRLQPFFLGGIGREFDGENNLLLTAGGSSLSIMDKPIETFEVVSLGLNVLGTGGWSGFIRADGLIGPDYHSASIRVGMRIR